MGALLSSDAALAHTLVIVAAVLSALRLVMQKAVPTRGKWLSEWLVKLQQSNMKRSGLLVLSIESWEAAGKLLSLLGDEALRDVRLVQAHMKRLLAEHAREKEQAAKVVNSLNDELIEGRKKLTSSPSRGPAAMNVVSDFFVEAAVASCRQASFNALQMLTSVCASPAFVTETEQLAIKGLNDAFKSAAVLYFCSLLLFGINHECPSFWLSLSAFVFSSWPSPSGNQDLRLSVVLRLFASAATRAAFRELRLGQDLLVVAGEDSCSDHQDTSLRVFLGLSSSLCDEKKHSMPLLQTSSVAALAAFAAAFWLALLIDQIGSAIARLVKRAAVEPTSRRNSTPDSSWLLLLLLLLLLAVALVFAALYATHAFLLPAEAIVMASSWAWAICSHPLSSATVLLLASALSSHPLLPLLSTLLWHTPLESYLATFVQPVLEASSVRLEATALLRDLAGKIRAEAAARAKVEAEAKSSVGAVAGSSKGTYDDFGESNDRCAVQ